MSEEANSDLERFQTVIRILSENGVKDVSLWGEQAMQMHDIPVVTTVRTFC